MTHSTIEKDALTARISRIVEELMEKESWFREKLDLEEMVRKDYLLDMNVVSAILKENLTVKQKLVQLSQSKPTDSLSGHGKVRSFV